MRTFVDKEGRNWQVSVTVSTIKRVRGICKVDLNSIVEVDDDNNLNTSLLNRLTDDPVLLVDVLYAVCKPEADKLGVTDEQFGEAMVGDVIANATAALLDEIVDFFPGTKRLAMQKILRAVRRFETATRQKLEEMDEKFENELASVMEKSIGSSTGAPASAE